MTALSTPIPMTARPRQAAPVENFVDRLHHPVPAQSAGPFVTLFQCLISFGLLPLVLWPMRWADFLGTEHHDLLDLADWWRSHVDAKDAGQLDKITRRLRPQPMLMVLPWLAVLFNVGLMGTLIVNGDSISRLWRLTIGQVNSHSGVFVQQPHWEPYAAEPWQHSNGVRLFTATSELNASPLEAHLYGVWITSLVLAYFCQWYAVRSYAVTVHSLVNWTNRLARESGLPRVKDESLKIGLNFLWIVLGIALCSQQVWWGIPMVFAGAFQRRYSMRSSPALRVALACQARGGFAIASSSVDRLCPIRQCGARLPAPARFCPRCGAGV